MLASLRKRLRTWRNSQTGALRALYDRMDSVQLALGRIEARQTGALRALYDRMDSIQLALGRIEARQTTGLPVGALAEAEFKVSSQWGEDGIMEHLLRHVPIDRTIFVEFGVENYREANTRFLLVNRNWSGLVLDGSQENIDFIRRDSIAWRHDLTARAAFITCENINDLIAGAGIEGDIGILSIDIDGNDYWVWDQVSVISPRIVIAEYNGIYGASATVSIPYDPAFYRTTAHHSNLYWGCSLAALAHVAERKGYTLVGSNSNGNNAFFVRRDVAGTFTALSPQAAYRAAKYRESRDAQGHLTFLSPDEGRRLISTMKLIDVVSGATITVADIPK
jgi:hypothetical protein